jgi:multiple sugar transport system permease protein
MAIVTVLALFPLFWTVSTSFKTDQELFTRPLYWLPRVPTLSNYAEAFGQNGLRVISNGLIVAFGGTGLALLLGFPAAYTMSRYRKRRFAVFIVPLIMRASPPVVLAIPLLVLYSWFGLADTTQGLTLVYGATTVFYIVWMIKPFIDAVPRELEDAAMVDGVPRWKLPLNVILPMVVGGVVVSTTFVFILNWTEYVLALSLTSHEARTAALHMAGMGATAGDWVDQGPAAALSAISLVPFLGFAYYLQKQLVRTFFVGVVGK